MVSIPRIIQSLKNIYHWLTAWPFVWWYRFPSSKLKVIGVTGTDGKTTTSHLIYEILKKAGLKVGLISTVAAYIAGDELDTGFHVTNPDARLLQKLLRKIADEGMEYLVLEVTSHGLDQNRVVGINFDMGVITNITHEHLDYHGNFAAYRDAKAKLVINSQCSIINKDDPSFEYLIHKTNRKVIAYGKTHLKITNPALEGEYNKYNLGAAEAVAKILKIEKYVPLVVRSFSGVPGRLQELQFGQSFRVIVDFAHTPNALEQLLTTLKTQKLKNSKLILVFGCASERDTAKRPMMGQIAQKLADKVIVTIEDPRHEDPGHIYQEITQGKSGFLREDDRAKAIQLAISLAKPGDIVVATGKGHEKSMNIGGVEYPWSDVEAFKQSLLPVREQY